MRTFFGRWFGDRERRGSTATSRRRLRPGAESLEGRAVPAAFINQWGDLVINQTNFSDFASVASDGFNYVVNDNGVLRYFPHRQVWGGDVFYHGFGGDDVFSNSTALNTYAYGGPGNDRLYGGSGNDWLYGGDGNDVLSGGFGNDYLFGEGGRDSLYGGLGDDYLDGGVGDGQADLLVGGGGADTFVQDRAKKGIWPFRSSYNRDQPDDFTPWEGDRIIG